MTYWSLCKDRSETMRTHRQTISDTNSETLKTSMTNDTGLIGTSDTQTYARHSSLHVLIATRMQSTASTSAVYRLLNFEHIIWCHHLFGLRLGLSPVASLTSDQLASY